MKLAHLKQSESGIDKPKVKLGLEGMKAKSQKSALPPILIQNEERGVGSC